MFAYITCIFHLFGVRIQIFLGILALSWGAMIASFILYTRLRSAAVSAAALLAFAIYVLLIYL